MATTLVQVRIDDELKNQATAVYDALGIDLSTAVRMFLKRS
ncbi:MAG: type II toxin-antitoxin system RelB/DinJ family antitoxin, partial [Lachnospiraceae bacterium]|nr:type II toxin-antitoxin system RelB/DinJ family antitoxin [Lachnospiraceae bacterium]